MVKPNDITPLPKNRLQGNVSTKSDYKSLFFNIDDRILTPPMLSQYSRSQALVKEEGCDRRGEPTLNLAILMEMKPERKPLGRNPLSDAPYRNLGMVLNRQGSGRHPLGDAPCRDRGIVSCEQGSGRRFLSGALHRRIGVVKNE